MGGQTEEDTAEDNTSVIQKNCDRISSLHDSILHHILSFLPTKHVAQTRILSRRWNELCVSLSSLNLEEFREKQKINFINFVNRLFLSRDMSIKISQFRLSFERACDNYHANAWITHAVRAGVEELDFFTKDSAIDTRSLPPCLFDCNSLVELKLHFHIFSVFQFPKFFCFPKMRRMHLSCIILPDNFIHLICKSPNLEYLLLKTCPIDIASKSLHTSQNLIADDHILGNFSCLIDANIDLINDFDIGGSGRFVSKFIRRFSNIKALTLSRMSIMILACTSYLLDHFPTFCNLKHLQLGICTYVNEMRTMADLLQCSPVLQTLRIGFYFSCVAEGGDLMPEEFPSLPTVSTLKSITVDNFLDKSDHRQVVRLFLANAPFLENFVVHKSTRNSPFKVVDPISLYEKLLQFPRLSRSCVLRVF